MNNRLSIRLLRNIESKSEPLTRNKNVVRIIRLWWAEVDSNHRSRRRQIYSLIHLAALESAHIKLFCCGAGDWTRTHNLLITNQLLCQLSYTGRCVPYRVTKNLFSIEDKFFVVPWGGIEPPTGRFSVCCSTN